MQTPSATLRSMSLARRFLLANLVVVVAASVAVGAWTGLQVESGVIGRTAAMTGLYIESFVEPGLASLATGTSLTTAEIAALDILEPAWLRRWLPGLPEVPGGTAIRSRYAEVALDAAWALFKPDCPKYFRP